MGRVGKPNKGKAQRKHAMSRAHTRLNFTLTNADYDAIVQGIHDNRYTLVEKQSNRVSKFLVKMKGDEFVVVFDKKRDTIITFLYNNIEDDSILKNVFGWLKN